MEEDTIALRETLKKNQEELVKTTVEISRLGAILENMKKEENVLRSDLRTMMKELAESKLETLDLQQLIVDMATKWAQE